MKDPICGMEVDPKKAESKGLVTTKKEIKYYFCSENCKSKFSNNKIEIIAIVSLLIIAVAVFLTGYMLPFMGIVFLILSGLKLIDIKGFANMFAQYDLVAKKIKLYGLVYPFIELGLALLFLFQYQIKTAAIITIVIMTVGSIGIAKNLFSKNKIQCACLGAKLKIPLTRFTLVEDIVMVVMGVMILILL